MRIDSRSVAAALILLVAATLAWLSVARGDDGKAKPAVDHAGLVNALDHDSFQTREHARLQLLGAAAGADNAESAAARSALRRGLQHKSIEARIAASEILQEIVQIEHERQIERLLNPRCDPDTVQLDRWHCFAAIAGRDMAARRWFATLSDAYPQVVADRQAGRKCTDRLVQKLDPYRIPSDDTTSWIMLLWHNIEQKDPHRTQLSPRIGMALSNSVMGPSLEDRDDDVLRRIISRWLEVAGNGSDPRQQILIAMRFECHGIAATLCDAVLSDSAASPASQVTALLTSLVLSRPDLESRARARLNDDRTAHVWQLIASRKTKIRTQVRDVALVVLLHQHGVDPRMAGFDDLQADPTLIFRDHSLGFPDETSRRRSYKVAMDLLPPLTP